MNLFYLRNMWNLNKSILFLCLAFLFFYNKNCNAQLIINVKNQGGDIVQESIFANISDNTVTLEFQRSDGTLITQFIDFTNDVQVLKGLVLGEEERGQSQYQVMCFVLHYNHGDFIPADAMAKLRQKNPGAIRVPEQDLGRMNYTMDRTVNISKAASISPHVSMLCNEAQNATYTRHSDLLTWAHRPGASESALLTTVTTESASLDISPCAETPVLTKSCTCRFESCVGWYPCGLKYCKSGNAMSYRCGIKTCRRCYQFSYFVKQKQMCLWDD